MLPRKVWTKSENKMKRSPKDLNSIIKNLWKTMLILKRFSWLKKMIN